MKQIIVMALALSTALAAELGAARGGAKRESVESTSSGSSSRSPQVWGVGAAYIPGRNAYLNGLTASLIPNDQVVIDGFLGMGSSSVSMGGTDTNGKPSNSSVGTFGLAGAVRYNALRPGEHLLFQLTGRLSYVSTGTTTPSGGKDSVVTSTLIGIYAGGGFEAFFPAWPNLSMEASAGLNFLSGSTVNAPPGVSSVTTSESAMFIGGGNGFLPLNLALHYYFR